MPLQKTRGVEKRLFVVGCSRSGTTVLQVSIASHPRIQSFPETGFFVNVLGDKRKKLARLGLSTGREKKAFARLLDELERPDWTGRVPRRPWLFNTSAQVFVQLLDEVTMEAGKDIWLEKTPMHVLHTDLMQHYVPDAHFIHIIRDGRDVVASLYDRAKKHPGRFRGNFSDPVNGVKRWNESLKASLGHLDDPAHSFVLYEQFVASPGSVMQRICRDVGIEYDPCMAQGSSQTADEVVPEERTWITKAKERPAPQPSKFDRLFSESERHQIAEQLDLEKYRKVERATAAGEGG